MNKASIRRPKRSTKPLPDPNAPRDGQYDTLAPELMREYLRLLDDRGAVFVEVPSIDRLAAGAASSYDNLYPHHRHTFPSRD